MPVARSEPKPPPTEQEAWGRLCAWFAMQAHTREQSVRKLRQWNVAEDVAARLLERLESIRLVDDVAYANQFADELVRKGYRGPAVFAKLRARGIEGNVAATAIHGAESDVDAFEQAIELARRRARADDDPRRIAAYLARRGFSAAVAARTARAATNEVAEQHVQ